MTTQTLISWNLNDLYTSFNDPLVKKDLNDLDLKCTDFQKTFEPSKGGYDSHTLLKALKQYEEIQELSGRLMSFAYLLFSTKSTQDEVKIFFQNTQDQVTQSYSKVLFFTLHLTKTKESDLNAFYENSKELKFYKPWIDSVRLYKDHQLSDEIEQILFEKSVAGRQAFERLYEETLTSISEDHEGKPYSFSDILNLFAEKDESKRYLGATLLNKALEKNSSLLTLITNTLAKDKEIEDRWRGYKTPMSSRHLSNQVEEDVVEALIKTVKKNYPKLSHRYYALKAKWMKKEKLEYWDRNAPLEDSSATLMSWDEAKETVLSAYGAFSATTKEIAARFFDHNWIDANPSLGKDSGAYSHPTVPSVHPYILMNFHGKLRDVMTLAHELGHGIHQVLSAPQGPLLSDTPLTLAETASVFGEMLTFKSLLKKTTSTQEKKALIAAKVEDMLNTVVRQVAFYEFEKQVHLKRKEGELSSKELNEIWLSTQKEALGEAVNLDPLVSNYWSYISHFIRSPFYVYAYAFGDCLVNSLYAVYEKGFDDFQETYLTFLKAGGSKNYKELLAMFNLDPTKEDFWQNGLSLIESFIDELEAL
ncbi:MAG TPA: M3 family oligoendopeptidase [Alphaproteobacteria bacterium]|nr:M3 family oligoendopeptidase [Alphaproteobacteria bacterium]